MITAAPRHYGIVVSDLERALGFYRDLLDLKVARQMDETGPFIETVLGMPGVDVTTCKMEAEKGGTQVELLCFKSHKDPSPRPPQPYFVGPTHMAFTVDDLAALHGRMAANGVQFVSPPQVSADGNAKVAFCRDPDGTLLELVELIRRQEFLMTVRIGTMQGRLLPRYEGRFQAFPAGLWREEFINAQKAGLYCIEWIYEEPHEDDNPLRTDEGLAQMKAVIAETGVQVRSICADYYMARPLVTDVNGVDRASVDHLRWLMTRAKALGASYIVLPFVDASSLKTENARQKLITLLKNMGPEAQALGVELHLETDFPPTVFSAILSAIDHSNVRWNYDIGNSASLGYAANDEFDAQGKYLGSVHIKDRVRGGSTVPLGSGSAEVDVSLKRILETGFDRWFILQVARDKEGDETAWLASVRADVERRLATVGKN